MEVEGVKPCKTAALRYRIDWFTRKKSFHSRDVDKRLLNVESGRCFKTEMTSSGGRWCNMRVGGEIDNVLDGATTSQSNK